MTESASARRTLTVRHDFSPFGNKLIQAGYVNTEQMRQAEAERRKSKRPLTEIIELIIGQALPPDLLRQYKKQQLFELKILHGIECFDLETNKISINQVSELIETLITIDVCRLHRLIPLVKNETQPPGLLVGMVEPDNPNAQDDLERILKRQGLKFQRLIITLGDYQQLIYKYLDEQVKKEEAIKAEKYFDIQAELAGLENIDLDSLPNNSDAEFDLEKSDPANKLVNKILAKALKEKVSDIHVEPQEEYLRIRFRQDGVLREAFNPLPKKIIPTVTTRLKIIANLDISKRQIPQIGRITRMFEGRKVNFIVSTLPSRYGESVVLRILDNSFIGLGLDNIIYAPETLQIFRQIISRPRGLILITGPTDSGKSITLYSALAERNVPGVKICTVEDQIEYKLPGITQVEALPEKEKDNSSILQAFLHQDADVIMVGETRDKETAKAAIEAAIKGRLVLTALHAEDAASAISHLREMGVESYMLSGSIIGVLAQRLIRRVCADCRIAYTPVRSQLARFGLSASSEGAVTFYKANAKSPEEIHEAKANGTLCPQCNGIGYKGRVGVYEVMRITERLQTLISQDAPSALIKETAVQEGMISLLGYSLNLMRQGYTTLEEVEGVTFADTSLEVELAAKYMTSLTCHTCGADLKPEWRECCYCLTPVYTDSQLVAQVGNAQQLQQEFEARLNHEKAQSERAIREEIALKLLPIVDVIELAKTQIQPATTREASLHKGYQILYPQLVSVLKNIGVSAIDTEGKNFDPYIHEAVSTAASDRYPEGTVIAEIKRGYLLGDRVLRPAQVKVAAPAKSDENI